jgi:hypothetical protein
MTIAWNMTMAILWQAFVIAQQRPLIDRLDPKTRGKVILALAGLVMLGLLMIVMTWLTFRIIRRRIKHAQDIADRQRRTGRDEDDWSKKPL